MRDCPEYIAPVNTTAEVVICFDGVDDVRYRVECEGYAGGDEVTLLAVESVYLAGGKRPCLTDEAAALIRLFWRMWENEEEFFGERHDAVRQMRKAISDEAYYLSGEWRYDCC